MNIQLLTLALGLALVAPVFADEDAAKSDGEVRRHSHDMTTQDVPGDKANETEILPHDEFQTSHTPDKVEKEKKKHHKKKHHKKKKKAEDAALSSDDHKAEAPKAEEHKEDAPKADAPKADDHKDAAPAEEKKS